MTDQKSSKLASDQVEEAAVQALEHIHLLPSENEFAKILRKVDWRIIPVAFACYFVSTVDKLLINYANVMGLQQDLGMEGNDFSWMATSFFIAFAVAEIPQGWLLQRFPISMVLGGNVLGWGIAVMCSAAARNFRGMVALRVILGFFEACIGPSLVLITSMWYTKRQSAPRYGLWFCGLGAAQIIGGLISFGAQHHATAGLAGWRVMMLVVGAVNICLALIILLFLPDSLETAKFLTTTEKESLRSMLIMDQAGNGAKVLQRKGLVEVFTDTQVWLLFLLTIFVVMPSGMITTYSSTIIRSFGYDSKQAALLNMPSGIVSITATMIATYAILRRTPRWLSITLIQLPTFIGASLMAFLSNDNQAGKLAGAYLINTCVAPMAIIFTWVGANTAGYTKRVCANAVVMVGFSIANIIGPQTFQARDRPQYIPAIITILASAGGSILVTFLLRLLYVSRNQKATRVRQDQLVQAIGESKIDAVAAGVDETDCTNPAFIYVY